MNTVHPSFFNNFSSNSTSHTILASKSRQQDFQIARHIQEWREGNAFVLTTWFGWWKFINLYTVQDSLAKEWCFQMWAISFYNNLLKTIFHRPASVDNLSLRLLSQATVRCVKLTIRANYPRRSRCLSPHSGHEIHPQDLHGGGKTSPCKLSSYCHTGKGSTNNHNKRIIK